MARNVKVFGLTIGIIAVALVVLPGNPGAWAGGIVLGMNAPVTGGSAAEGAYMIKAMKLAVKQTNEGGGVNGKKIAMVIQDNQSSNPGALAALNKSLEQDRILALLGPVKSTQILAMSDAINAAAVPTMIGGTNVRLTKQGNPWLFRCRPDDSIVALAMVKYIKEEMKLTKVGILHDTDAFGTGGADLVEQESKKSGLTVVRREKYTTKEKDFTAQLLALRSSGAEVMVLYATNPEDTAVIQRQYRQLGSPYKYLGSQSGATKDAMNLAREAGEGLLSVIDWAPGTSDRSRKYAEDYRKEYGEEMDPASVWNYDAVNILAAAIRKAGEDRSKIREAILGMKDYAGVIGKFAFTPNGDGLHSVAVIQVARGQHKLMKVVEVGAY